MIARETMRVVRWNLHRRGIVLAGVSVEEHFLTPIHLTAPWPWSAKVFVGLVGFEPTASCTRGRRSTKLSHSPKLHCEQDSQRATHYFAHLAAHSKRLEDVWLGAGPDRTGHWWWRVQNIITKSPGKITFFSFVR